MRCLPHACTGAVRDVRELTGTLQQALADSDEEEEQDESEPGADPADAAAQASNSSDAVAAPILQEGSEQQGLGPPAGRNCSPAGQRSGAGTAASLEARAAGNGDAAGTEEREEEDGEEPEVDVSCRALSS